VISVTSGIVEFSSEKDIVSEETRMAQLQKQKLHESENEDEEETGMRFSEREIRSTLT